MIKRRYSGRNDYENPLAWSHNKVEGKLEYSSLLYVPARAPFDLYQREAPKGLKLYVRDKHPICPAAAAAVPPHLLVLHRIVRPGPPLI